MTALFWTFAISTLLKKIFMAPFYGYGSTVSILQTEAAVRRWCSLKFRNIHRKTLVLESLFNNVAGLQGCNFLKKRLQHRCFPVNIGKFLRNAFL